MQLCKIENTSNSIYEYLAERIFTVKKSKNETQKWADLVVNLSIA